MASDLDKTNFASNLRLALSVSELSQESLARELGVSLGAVSLWCRGKRLPDGANLLALARALDREMDWFFAGSPTPDTEREAA